MPIYVGANKIGAIYYAGNKIGKVYYGSNLVYTSHSETLLGNVIIYGTGDYIANYYSNAKAYLVRDGGKQYLKITGYWYNMGNNVSGQVTQFITNIFVGTSQTAQTDFNVYQYSNTQTPSGTPYTVTGHVDTSGYVWLPLAHENRYRTFNQFDKDNTLIELDPA